MERRQQLKNARGSAQRGISLMEYTLVGGLVAVVCVGGCIALGTDLQNYLQGALGRMNGKTVVARAAAETRQAVTFVMPDSPTYDGPPVDGAASLPPLQPGEQRVCYEGGFCLNLPKPDSNGVETAGGNGGELAQAYTVTLDQLVKQLAETPEVDSRLTQLVTDLANKGHAIADKQFAADQYLDCASNNTCAVGTLADVSNDVSKSQDAFFIAKAQLDQYLQQNPTQLPSALQEVINSGAETIDELAAVTQDNLNYKVAVIDPNSFAKIDVEANVSAPPAVSVDTLVTEASSNGICGSGGDKDECVRNVYGSQGKGSNVEVDVTDTSAAQYLSKNKKIRCDRNGTCTIIPGPSREVRQDVPSAPAAAEDPPVIDWSFIQMRGQAGS